MNFQKTWGCTIRIDNSCKRNGNGKQTRMVINGQTNCKLAFKPKHYYRKKPKNTKTRKKQGYFDCRFK